MLISGCISMRYGGYVKTHSLSQVITAPNPSHTDEKIRGYPITKKYAMGKTAKKSNTAAATEKYFGELKATLERAGLYTYADETVVRHAAKTLALIEEAEVLLEQHGHLQFFQTGAIQIHPAINNYRGLLSDFRRYADDLGLSPGARRKLNVTIKKEVKSALAALRPAVNG